MTALRDVVADAIEALIAVLDALDGDADAEPDADDEPEVDFGDSDDEPVFAGWRCGNSSSGG